MSSGEERIIWDVIGNDIGLARADCEVINLTDEEPEKKNGCPSPEAIDRCAASFRSALAASQARVLVPLDVGTSPLLKCLGLAPSDIERLRGYVLEPRDLRPALVRERRVVGTYKTNSKHGNKGDDKWGWVETERTIDLPSWVQWIVPTLHPRYIRLDGFKSIPCLKADLDRARRLSTGMRPVEFGYGNTMPSAVMYLALDLELPRGYVELVGASDGTETWADYWNACSADKVNKAMGKVCTTKIFHNASYDIPHLEHEGINVRGPVWDTMLATHLIQPDLYKSLEKSSTLYLDLRPFKYLSTGVLERPAADAQVSALMFQRQRPILEQTGQLALFEQTIMPATRVLMGMTKRGLKVDQTYLDKWQRELTSRLTTLTARWYASVGQVNPHSTHQVRKLLYKDWSLPEQGNKYAEVTTDEGALKTLAAISPDHAEGISLLLEIREVAKLKGTYSEVEIGPDGCVHPNYLPESKDTDQGGAATGRLASRDPNIQNQPPEARRLFVPHQEGMVLVEADFSQIELRIAAALSQDTMLQRVLVADDPFLAIMHQLRCDRVRSKNVVYGSLYGAGPRKLSTLLKAKGIATTEAECKALQTRLAQAYPQLWSWRTVVGRTAVQERVLTNPFGRKRYFYAGSSDIPAAIDFLPQSCAADILWHVLVPASEAGGAVGGNILTTVHDSLLFECPQERVGSFVGAIRDILEDEWSQIAPGFRVPVKVRVGKNWGQMEEYNAVTTVGQGSRMVS